MRFTDDVSVAPAQAARITKKNLILRPMITVARQHTAQLSFQHPSTQTTRDCVTAETSLFSPKKETLENALKNQVNTLIHGVIRRF